MNNEYFLTLKTWCDKMISLQLDDSFDDGLRGGVLCPGCGYIHGRIADAIYPMITMYSIEKDEKYLNSAKQMYDWTVRNMERPDGSNLNDSYSTWKGTTVFFGVSLLQTLIYHKDILPKEMIETFEKRLKSVLDFCYDFINSIVPAVNYKLFLMPLYALAYKYFGLNEYKEKAQKSKEVALTFVNQENFIFGEPKSVYDVSKKGGYLVDIGYNVEESISAFTIYGEVMNDEEITKKALDIAKAHKVFLLSNGALDNSFGSRMAKWSYWGSRTSDGCQEAFCSLAKYDSDFSEYAKRSFDFYKECEVDGLLAGGLHFKSAKERPCVHHTFCHAKAAAFMLDSGFEYTPSKPKVWYEDYLKRIDTLNVTVINRGDFRATVSDFDCDLSGTAYPNTVPSGGSLTLLQSKKIGAIFAASSPTYSLVEPTNMQQSRFTKSFCQTLRIEENKNDPLRSDMDFFATVKKSGDFKISVEGHLSNRHKEKGAKYNFSYEFLKDGVIINAECEKEARLIMPIVAKSTEKVFRKKGELIINKEKGTLLINTDKNIENLLKENERNFNFCGGFETYYSYIDLKPNEKVLIDIKVKGE